jgi:hypothetical protein
LVVFDQEGAGGPNDSPSEMILACESKLASCGWRDRAKAVVIQPELEAWVWSDSNEVDAALAWKGQDSDLRNWLVAKGYLESRQSKPKRPKETLTAALRFTGKPTSSSIFQDLARRVSIRRCKDPAFERLRTILREWFPRK